MSIDTLKSAIETYWRNPPEVAAEKLRKIYAALDALEPSHEDFEITHIRKILSTPASWHLTIKEGEVTATIVADSDAVSSFEKIMPVIMGQSKITIPRNLKNSEWRQRIADAIAAGNYEEEAAPEECTTAGILTEIMTSFKSESKENPDVGLLRKYMGHNDKISFILFNTIRERISDQGDKIPRNELAQWLKGDGWVTDRVFLQKKQVRAWTKPFKVE